MADHGVDAGGTPVHHGTHDHDKVLAREFVSGWFAGHAMRSGDSGPMIVWSRGFVEGVEERGNHDD